MVAMAVYFELTLPFTTPLRVAKASAREIALSSFKSTIADVERSFERIISDPGLSFLERRIRRFVAEIHKLRRQNEANWRGRIACRYAGLTLKRELEKARAEALSLVQAHEVETKRIGILTLRLYKQAGRLDKLMIVHDSAGQLALSPDADLYSQQIQEIQTRLSVILRYKDALVLNHRDLKTVLEFLKIV
jgi:hypothetical protein